MNYPVKMYEYHVWANQAIFNRLLELPGELHNQKITSIFPTVSEALIHIYTADLGWINNIGNPLIRIPYRFRPAKAAAKKPAPNGSEAGFPVSS